MTRHLALEPFRALRFDPDRVSDLGGVTSPPYDMVDGDTADALRRAEPHNVVRLILDPDGADAAARRLADWRECGVLIADETPALYAYEQRSSDRVLQRGLLGALRLPTAAQHVVLPHEDVMPGPVAGRLALLRATEANLEPLLLTYDDYGGATRQILEEPGEPLIEASVPDGPDRRVEHRIRRIEAPESLAQVAADLAERRALIADGHHRYAAALQLQEERGAGGPWDTVLALLVDHGRYPPQVGAIHRVLPGIALADVLRAAGDRFTIAPAAPSDEPLDAALVTDGEQWVRLRPPPGAGLPVHAVDETLLRGGLGVGEESVRYVHDRPGAVRTAVRHSGIAFVLPSVSAAEVLDLAGHGRRMPRKSTSFGPKPRTGLVFRTFDI